MRKITFKRHLHLICKSRVTVFVIEFLRNGYNDFFTLDRLANRSKKCF